MRLLYLKFQKMLLLVLLHTVRHHICVHIMHSTVQL